MLATAAHPRDDRLIPLFDAPNRSYFRRPMRREVPSNADMLAWVSDEERQVCRSCGEKACVTVANAAASFCLCCDAITIDGVRIDVDRRIPIDSAVFSGRAGSPLEAV